MIRVVVVDDEPIVRSGIALLLAGEPDIEVIADVEGEPGVVDLVRRRQPDVVIADVRMPVMDGVELTRRIVGDPHRIGNVPKVLVLTTFHVDEAVYAALRAGATGFLKTLAREVAADGVTVNSVQPGLHETERLVQLYGGRVDGRELGVPAGVVGRPEDFGATVAYLCSDQARFITGLQLHVDGGAYAGLL